LKFIEPFPRANFTAYALILDRTNNRVGGNIKEAFCAAIAAETFGARGAMRRGRQPCHWKRDKKSGIFTGTHLPYTKASFLVPLPLIQGI
jgi:hypothetical protein